MPVDTPFRYPPSPVEPVAESFHGTTVEDPYRWLEDGDSEPVRAWVAAQNRLTRTVLDGLGCRAPLAARLGELHRAGRISAPRRAGPYLFLLVRQGDDEQPVLVRRTLDGSERRVLYAPDDGQGPCAIDWYEPSRSGERVALGISRGGDEWSTLEVVDAREGLLADRIARCRTGSVAWEPDGRGFYYTRHPAPSTVAPGEEHYHPQVFHHVLGTEPQGDPLVFGQERERTDTPVVQLTEDGRHVIVTVIQGWVRTQVFHLDRQRPQAGFRRLTPEATAVFLPVLAGRRMYVRTNLDAPCFRVLVFELEDPEKGFTEFLPERDPVLEAIEPVAGGLAALYLEHVSSRLAIVRPEHTLWPPLPDPVSISTLTAAPDDGLLYLVEESFDHPTRLVAVDPATGSADVVESSPSPPLPDVRVQRDWAVSWDGTRVPMYIIRPAGVPLGPLPTVLTGYGGFSISMTPAFNPSLLTWVQRGGAWAIASLRGGGEFGERWHEAGMRERKQNVFDDFLAAARHLVDTHVTTRERLGIMGGSNGGLLVGAALTQAPEQFGAVVCRVPLLDMLRFHRFLIAALWTSEYGSSEDPEAFQWLRAYSPYHHVVAGRTYPATLLLTAESDSRVDPLHARKMTARLQAAQAASDPILLRVESQAGHGVGKPLYKVVAEQSDILAFLAWRLELGL